MTESSRFWQTNGTGDGPSGGYSAQQFYDFLRKLLITDQQASQGVIFGEQGELACSGTASPIAVAAGSAIAYGFFYENTASLNLTVTTPSGGTTGGRVNLKVDWTAQTVRAIVNRNADGNPAIPALTQNPGSVYEIPLATFTITTGGVITLTDARSFIEIGAKLLPNSIDTEALQDDAITQAKIAAGAVGTTELADDGVTQAKIASGAVGTTEMANDSVDDTKAGNRVPMLTRRQGGDATDWSIKGTTNYTPTAVKIQCGSGSTNTSGDATITFPQAFSAAPNVVITTRDEAIIRDSFGVVNYRDATYFEASLYQHTGDKVNRIVTFDWIAVGPE